MYGGHTYGEYGAGATHTNIDGGATSGAYGTGVTHTYPSGATACGYPAYHPPVAVHY